MIGHAAPTVKATPRIGVPFDATPLDVRRRRDLTHAAKSVFAAIANFARMEGGDLTTATNRQLANAVGMTPSGVRRPLDELEGTGLIHRVLAAGGRVREAIRVTYSPSGVGAETTTQGRRGLARPRQEGWREDAKGVGAPAPTPLTKNEEPLKTVGNLDSVEEKTESSPPLSPESIRQAIADGMRQAVGGEHAAMIFDVEPSTPTASTTKPSTTPTAKPATTPTTPATKTTAPYNGLDLRRVGVSAVAACFSPSWGAVRNSPEDLRRQVAELRKRRKRGGPPSPAPVPEAGPSPAKSTQSGYFRPNG